MALRSRFLSTALPLMAFLAPSALELHAQESSPPEAAPPEPSRAGIATGEPDPRFDWGFEVKTHFRSSDAATAGTPSDPVDGVPITLETVDEGESFEVSTVSLFADAHWGANTTGHLKVDIIDLYDRNPTSTDREVDVDEAWIRFGTETDPGEIPEERGFYVKAGKFPHFERQDDRSLESYGQSTTAFNRFEDIGVELGVDLHPQVYLKASLTQGNPVFFRDPNALAGDTGATLLDPANAELGSGLGLIYDAEVEDVGSSDHLEVGLGLGFRFGNAYGTRNLDLLFWGYRRELADSVDLEGASLGGDLALLVDLPDSEPLPVTGDEKEEWGFNIWYYDGPFAFFGQYVDQDLAGLTRFGYEAEFSWQFELEGLWTEDGDQFFGSLIPTLRYSRLQADFEHPDRTVLPSLAWDWYKVDVGLRLEIQSGLDLTAEYAFNHGYLTDVEEFLLTLRWRR